MSTEERVSVQVARRFDVSPRRLFDAWTDPRKVRAWLATPPLALDVVELDLKARAGRPWSLVVGDAARSSSYSGEWIEVIASQRLVVTWVEPDVSKETTLVTVGFHAIPSAWAATDLRLEHARVLPRDAERTESRWRDALDALAAFISRTPASP